MPEELGEMTPGLTAEEVEQVVVVWQVSQQAEMTGSETGVGIPGQVQSGGPHLHHGVLTVALNGSLREAQCSNIQMYPEVGTIEIQGPRVHLVKCQGEETPGRVLGVVEPAHTIYQTEAGILVVKTCQGGAKDQALWPKVLAHRAAVTSSHGDQEQIGDRKVQLVVKVTGGLEVVAIWYSRTPDL